MTLDLLSPPNMETPPQARPLRVAVVGLGRAGLAQAAAFSVLEGCTLEALAEPSRSARKLARSLGFSAPAYPTLERLLAQSTPDAVVICAPAIQRPELARLALQAGAAVLVERPLGADLAAAEAVAALAREKALPLTCCFTLPHHPMFARARQLLAAGALGRLREGSASLYASRVFEAGPERAGNARRAGGGVGAQLAVELLAVVLEAVGAPARVEATTTRLYGDAEDEIHARLITAAGPSFGVECSWSMPGHPRITAVVELSGDNGQLLLSDDALEITLREPRAGLAAGATQLRVADLGDRARFDLDGGERWLADAAFRDRVLSGTAAPAELDLALSVQRTLDAIYRSAQQDGRTVEVAR